MPHTVVVVVVVVVRNKAAALLKAVRVLSVSGGLLSNV